MSNSKKISKKILVLTLASFTSLAFAEIKDPSFYVGGDLGMSRHNYSSHVPSNVRSSIDKKGIAGRFAVGYHFNEHFDTELGYGVYHKVGIKDTDDSLTVQKNRIRHRAVDLLARGNAPLNDEVAVFAEGGLAYVNAKAVKHVSGTLLSRNLRVKEKFFTPAYGVGVSYNISDKVQATLGARHYKGRHSVGSTDFGYVGLNFDLS